MVGYMSFSVRTFVPPPVRCFKCQRYGHTANVCKGKQTYGRCGKDHAYGDCGSNGAMVRSVASMEAVIQQLMVVV